MRDILRSSVFLLLAVIASGLAATASAAPQKRILLLHSYGENFAPYAGFTSSFRTRLLQENPVEVDLYDVPLLGARFLKGQKDGPFIDYLRALFPDERLDLVVAIGGPAVSFATMHRDDLFPAAPMLVTGVDERRVDRSKLTSNDTLVAVKLDFVDVVRQIRSLFPRTEQISIVFGSSEVETYWVRELKQDFAALAGPVRFDWLDDKSFDEMKAHVAALPKDSAVLFGMLSVDADGVPHAQQMALREIAATANAPTFGLFDTQIGQGIVGGALVSSDLLAERAAAVAMRMLGGDEPGGIVTPTLTAERVVFDWEQLQRWGLREADLPAGSELVNRSVPLWRQYPTQSAFIAAVVLLQSCFIAALLYESGRRRRAEQVSRIRLNELAHVNRQATAGELSASMAHELAQPLGAMLAHAEAAHLVLKGSPGDAALLEEILSDVKRETLRASEIIARLRRLLKKAPLELESVDLNRIVDEVFKLVAAQAQERGVELVKVEAAEPLVVRGDPIQLQQVILNLVVNGIDSIVASGRDRGRIIGRVTRLDGALAEIAVIDTGQGIPAEKLNAVFDPFYTTKEHGMGMGLSIARTIVEAHGGSMVAENRWGSGAVFRIQLPLAS